VELLDGVLRWVQDAGIVGELGFGGQQPAVLERLAAVSLIVFPYLLLRFLGTFEPLPARWRRAVEVAVVLQTLGGIVLPLEPRADGSLPPGLPRVDGGRRRHPRHASWRRPRRGCSSSGSSHRPRSGAGGATPRNDSCSTRP
jgi:hypothetical protein